MRIPQAPLRTLAACTVVTLLATSCLTPKREEELGREEAKKVAAQMGLIEDPVLNAYVRAIGAKLTAVSERPEGPWEFHVADTPEPNAFALPGGFVYVTRGLLALTNSEDELAGVIGHEVAHVTARHASKRISAVLITAPVNIATGLAGLAVSIVSPSLGRVLAGTGQLLTGGLVIAPFGREQEHEADAIGQGLAAKAGYDPDGISHFLHTLGRESTLVTGEEREFHFLDSHPMTPDRVERTRERSAELEVQPGRPVARNQEEFLDRLEGIVVGDDPAQGLFEESLFLHPELDLAFEFPEGWKTANTAEAVAAISPPKDALVSLRIAEMDTTVAAVVEKSKEEQSGLEFEFFEIRGLDAARTRVQHRGHVALITFIGYGGIVYAVVGQTAENVAEGYAPVFEATAKSFRALRTSERARIAESRLRIRPAKSGETPEAIAERTGSSWKPPALAIANAVELDTRLESGALVKVAISQPYTPR